MFQLTPPTSGQIKAIIHISDVHIKIGDVEKSRYTDFIETFSNLEKIMMCVPQVKQKCAVTVFTGDFFHYKNRLDSLSVKLFNILIDTITRHTPLYIIQGNHDFLQSDTNIPDVISSLLHGSHNHMVNYLDHTGHYVVNNVGFGLVSIKDVLKLGNGSGYVETLPSFPSASVFPNTVTTTIALFHGSLNKSVFYNGQLASDCVPIDWIKSANYQLGLFGDIHKAQVYPRDVSNIRTEFTWGYPGSLLQLDFGEDPVGHGFLLWDLEKETVNHYEIPSPTTFLNMCYDQGRFMFYLDRKSKLPFTEFKRENTKHINIKIKNDTPSSTLQQLDTEMKDLRISYNVVKSLVSLQFNGSDGSLKQPTKQSDISHYNSPDMWIDYIQKNNKDGLLTDQPWKEWIRNPESLLLSHFGITNPELSETIKTRDSSTRELIDKLSTNLAQTHTSKKLPFRVLQMKWDWILCFGKGNFYDFTNSTNKISIINGPNSAGKTSFLETLTFGLYGTEFPSRKDTSNSSVMICQKKPVGETANIVIVFSVGDLFYRITRVLEPQKTTKNVCCKSITLERLDPLGKSLSQITSSVKSANAWISEHVGTPESFMMSCLITQNSDYDFYDLKSDDQISMLDKVLHLDCIDDISAVIKSTDLALKDMTNKCQAMKTYIMSSTLGQPIDCQVIKTMMTDLTEKSKQLNQLKSEYDHFQETWHHLQITDLTSDDTNIQEKITQYQDVCSRIILEISDIEILSQVKAVILDKLKSLGQCTSLITYQVSTPQKLSELESQQVIKPQCDRSYYQHELDMINKWKTTNSTVLRLNKSEITRQLQLSEENLESYTATRTVIYNSKPNRPEISIKQYDVFTKQFARVEQKIKDLGNTVNTIDKLKLYCQQNPLPIVDHTVSLLALTTKLNDGIKSLSNPRLYECSDTVITDNLKSTESAITIINETIHTTHQQISQVTQEIEKLERMLIEYETTITHIGHLTKPSIPYEEVSKWLTKYEQMSAMFPQKLEQVTLLESQCGDILMKRKTYGDLHEKIEKITTELKEIDAMNLPFNPKCDACCQQPWKIRQKQLKDTHSTITQQMKMIDRSSLDSQETFKQLEVTKQWIESYQKSQRSMSDYQRLNDVWVHYNNNIEQLQSTIKHKSDKQLQISMLRKQEAELRSQVTISECDKQRTQKFIDSLHEIINKKPVLNKIRQQIDDLNKWTQESQIHEVYQDYLGLKIDYNQQQKVLIDENNQWEKTRDLNDQLIRNCEESIQTLKHSLVILTEHDGLLSKEKTYLSKLSEWTIFESHMNQIKELKYCIYHHQLTELTQQIEQLLRKQEAYQNLLYWTDVQKYKPLYLKKKVMYTEITALEQSIQTLNMDYGHHKSLYDTHIKCLADIKTYDILVDKIKKHLNAIQTIGKMLSCYRTWLYTNVVIPEIVKMINDIASGVLQCNNYSLDGQTVEKSNKISIDWTFKTPSGTTTIEKAGGFMKHIYGLITRITLSRQGCSNINNTQLFMDETFVSSDIINLEKIPHFLSNLSEIFVHGVVLVSHLQTIKDCGDIAINIGKNPDNTSFIKFDGKCHLIPQRINLKCKPTTVTPQKQRDPSIPTQSVESSGNESHPKNKIHLKIRV